MSRFDTNKITWGDDRGGGPRQYQASALDDEERTVPVVPARAYEELLESAKRMANQLEGVLDRYAPGDSQAKAVLDDFAQGASEDYLFPVIYREVAEAFVHGSPEDHHRAELAVQKQLDPMLRV